MPGLARHTLSRQRVASSEASRGRLLRNLVARSGELRARLRAAGVCGDAASVEKPSLHSSNVEAATGSRAPPSRLGNLPSNVPEASAALDTYQARVLVRDGLGFDLTAMYSNSYIIYIYISTLMCS